LDIRNDAGFLWENFCILERIKRNKYNNIFANYYFWRTYDQKEIDFIEERDGKLFAYEFKLNREHSKAPSIFLETYKNSQYQTINRENYYKFLM
jgi:predicted AAA+ superfamily ATPase